MASTSEGDGDGDGDCVLLKCNDPNYSDLEADRTEIIISTSEISGWNFSAILTHPIVTIKASRNMLIQHSSYFHGLLCGSFSESSLNCISIRWDLETIMNILKFMIGFPVDITSNNFLPLFEGALFFGVEMLLSKCKSWLIEETTPKGLCSMQIQLNDLIHIWRFSVEHAIDFILQLCTGYLARNFMWAIYCKPFPCVPSNLLLSCIQHPDLTIESERHLAAAFIVWLAANTEQFESSSSTNDELHIYLKEIRISLLPLWFVAGKRKCCYFSELAEESIDSILHLMAHPSTNMVNDSADKEANHLKIRLTQYTKVFPEGSSFVFSSSICVTIKKVDLSGCPQMTSKILLESMLSRPYSAEISLTMFSEQPSLRLGRRDGDQCLRNLPFEAVEEVDISNCPSLHLEAAINCFCKSFPFLRILKAAYYLHFNITHLCQVVQKCPLLTEVDLMVDNSPVLPSDVTIVSSSPAIVSRVSRASLGTDTSPSSAAELYMSRPLHSNLEKLTLEGRVDVSDYDLKTISSFCASLRYLNLRGCTSVTDAGISVLILRCSKLRSLFACGTSFGRNSIVAMSGIPDLDHCPSSEIGKDHCKSMASKFQELHMGGCKGVDATSLSKLMSQTPMLKSLCLRDTQSVDNTLYSFLGSSLQMLDVSGTKVSSAALAHIVSRNPGLKCLRAKGCTNLFHLKCGAEEGPFRSSEFSYNQWYIELVKACKLEEIALGWGLSSFSIEALKPAIVTLKAISVGLGATLGHNALELLPTTCPMLESVILYFQVISDCVLINLMGSLRHLQVLALCHCLGEISSVSFRLSVPNLRKLQLERVTPWMTNNDLVTLTQNCANLVELSLLGCRLLNSDTQQIISSGWPGLISIHLEDCGEVTVDGISALFECKALEDILLRHNGPGIQRDFIMHATAVMPMLRKVSVDVCDSVEGDFDIPNAPFEYRENCKVQASKMWFRPPKAWQNAGA